MTSLSETQIAVYGAGSALGQELLRTLADSGVSADQIWPLGDDDQKGQQVVFEGDTDVHILHPSDVPLKRADAHLFCGRIDALTPDLRTTLEANTALLLDLTGDVHPTAPIAWTGLDERPLKASGGWVRLPHGLSWQVLEALLPLHQRWGVARADVTAFMPVSEGGDAAMEELFDQARHTFLHAQSEPKNLPKRMAFNVIPQTGDARESGNTGVEDAVTAELQTMLGHNTELVVSTAFVPVFLGMGATIHVQMAAPVGAEAVRETLQQSQEVSVIPYHEARGTVTPEETVGEDKNYLCRVRVQDAPSTDVRVWSCADNFRHNRARPAVKCLETWLKKAAQS